MIVSDDQFSAISSNGTYCGTVKAVDDQIVELSFEIHTICLQPVPPPVSTRRKRNTGEAGSVYLPVNITDNDCKDLFGRVELLSE